jgi:hypothetical protein
MSHVAQTIKNVNTILNRLNIQPSRFFWYYWPIENGPLLMHFDSDIRFILLSNGINTQRCRADSLQEIQEAIQQLLNPLEA